MKLVVALIALIPLYTEPMQSEKLISFAKILPSQAKQLACMYPKTTAALLATTALGTTWYYANGYERREDWDNQELDMTKFPKETTWGTANSDLQLCGVQTVKGKKVKNSWTKWQKELITPKDNRPWWQKFFYENPNSTKVPRIPKKQRMGTATGHWDNYQEDFKLLKEAGIETFRTSIEWSKIQPDSHNEYDTKAMKYYNDYHKVSTEAFKEVTINGFHHAWPDWFDELGAFEKKENIKYYVDYYLWMVDQLAQEGNLNEIKRFLTFNEPAGYVLAAYVYGKYPPGEKMQLKKAGIVLKNMLDAHVEIYHKLKEKYQELQISIAHMMQPLQPYNPWNPLDVLTAKLFNHLLNNVTLEYLSTGKFKWLWYINETNEKAKGTLDFVGVNYYTHTLLNWFKPKVRPTEISSDAYEGEEGKALYAEGFYDSLKTVHRYFPDKPIMITELGFASENNEKRTEAFKRFFLVLQRAIHKDNMKILGVEIWESFAGYGWNQGNGGKHALFDVDYTQEDKPRKLKPSSEGVLNLIAQHKNSRNDQQQKETDTSINLEIKT